MIKVKDGVQFAVIAPGGFLILQKLKQVSRDIGIDLTITSGTDGEHSGPNDPHKRGEAYDIRSHDLISKSSIVYMLGLRLGPKFYAFLEDPDNSNEHIHVQVAKDKTFTIHDLLDLA